MYSEAQKHDIVFSYRVFHSEWLVTDTKIFIELLRTQNATKEKFLLRFTLNCDVITPHLLDIMTS